jgi:small subunit ribosomal protein S8
MKNYLWNMFTSINNGQLAKRSFILHPKKKICEKFLDVLWDEGFILGYKNYFKKVKTYKKDITKIFLKYKNGKPVINAIKPITKPGRRVYCTAKQIWKMNSKNTLVVFSTNKGLKTLNDCKKLKIGGELYIVLN